ncbi:MAG: Fe(3+)-binding periplasmic protein precursor [Pseudomonadota bacterium]|jgi:iron(III) transport system substrate-binding protein
MKKPLVIMAASLALLACSEGQQATGPDAARLTTAEIGQWTGDDRMQRMIDGAKAEGELNFYTSIPVGTTTQITEAFEAKYGIKVNMWRSESTQILQRAVNEARAGQHTADVVESAAAEVEAMQREMLLQEVNLPVFADLIEGAVVPGQAWVASRLTVFVTAYNTNLIAPEEVPRSFQDLLDPKWKGKIAIEAENANWLMAVSELEGQQTIETLFRDIATSNGLSVRRGHTLLVNLVASGEVPIGINAYSDHVDQAHQRGAPVDLVYMPPSIAMPLSVAAFRQAPHPHAAILFMDFILSDAQQMVVDQLMIPTNTHYSAQVNARDLHILDVPKYVDENAEWVERYRQLFSGR